MALQPLQALVSLPCLSIRQILMPPLSSKSCSSRPTIQIKCTSLRTASTSSSPNNETTIVRRSGNYQPAVHDDNFIQSLQSDYVGAAYEQRADKLKKEVKVMIENVVDPLKQLELVDTLQRLGLSYHFEHEIDKMLASIYNNGDCFKENENDLYATALGFRLLRQQGYNIPQEVFSGFMNESGNFKESLRGDTKGILCLYEASHLSVEDESILDKAKDFATKHLQDYVNNFKNHKEIDLEIVVSHALELPLHWRMSRLEMRGFVDVYEKRQDKNHILLEFAKLDYNMVQAIYQEDLKHTSRWWSSTGIVENLSFARDRIIENFFWAVRKTPEPQFRIARTIGAKFNALVTVVDDVYDIYGTLEELKLFTDIIERWDTDSMEQLPDYMKICFRALDNAINEMAPFVAVRTPDINVVSHMRKTWIDLCKLYLMEAEWYYSGYKPGFEEFINTGLVSVAGPLFFDHAYVLSANPVTEEALESLEFGKHHNLVRWSSLVVRLADDLGTSSEELQRGDNPKSIQCYMHETGASEEDARKHVRHVISTAWKKMNKDRVADSPFSKDFIRIASNLARTAQFMYLYGDGHSSQDQVTEDRIQSLLVQPIPL